MRSIRTITFVVPASVVASIAAAQQPGSRVRVSGPAIRGSTITGRLASVAHDTLFIARDYAAGRALGVAVGLVLRS